MASKPYAGNIPFNSRTGDQLHYPEAGWYTTVEDPEAYRGVRYAYHDAVEWKPNSVFRETLVFDGFRRGRSAAYAEFHDANNHKYTMFLTDLETILGGRLFAYGQIEGLWTFCKRGANFGVRAYTAPPVGAS